jgi:hypothetical protein
MLLRLRLANHRSIRDQVELSLVSTRMRAQHPPDSDWANATNRIAGIYGANASGKSTVLHGFRFLTDAVRQSATSWSDRQSFPHTPFAFDAESRRQSSLYEVDFTVTGVRHTYGFRTKSNGIEEEWLYAYPTARRRMLFERSAEDIEFGRTLPGDNVRIGRALRPTQLFLSLAAANKHSYLSPVRRQIIDHFRFARFDETDQEVRLRYVMRLLADQDALKEAEALLQLADLGISALHVQDVELPAKVREIARKMLESITPTGGAPILASDFDNFIRDYYEKQFRFIHGSEPDDLDHGLPISDESSGTVAWLALAVPALESLRNGDTFVVDEIDSSLHPRLTARLIGFFRNPTLNTHGSQLIFTSHDTSLLGRLHGELLAPEEVWATEKDATGGTDLYSLAEFSVRGRDNLERRYLQGRYGGVPVIGNEALVAELARKSAS